jgi:hypothetical protein
VHDHSLAFLGFAAYEAFEDSGVKKSRFDIAGLVESALSTHEEQVRIGQSRVKWSPAFSSSEPVFEWCIVRL